jgi:hypothetical protein
MKRILIEIILVLFSSGILAATNYYVDATNGNDSNNGTSQGTAWKTITKVSQVTFSPGDSILFKRGEIFRGSLTINQSGNSGMPITYGAYGVGNKPLILGSVSMNSINDWTLIGTNLWATSDIWATPNNSFPSDVGFVLLGEEKPDNVGFKVGKIEYLDTERKFWYDTANLRVILYSPQNPALHYQNIEIAKSYGIFHHLIQASFSGASFIHIQDLAIKYWNAHAIAFVDAFGIEIKNCDISYGGGVCYWQDPVTGGMARLGNGIEFWESAQNCIVDGCKIGQIFDSGVSPQAQGTPSTVSDIFFTNNIFWGNDMASFEIAYASYQTTVQNIHFVNNISIGAGRGWARAQKLHADMGWDVTTWAGWAGVFDGFYLKNNVYYRALDASVRTEWQGVITNFEMDSNYYYKPEDGVKNIMMWWPDDIYSMSEFDAFKAEQGQDANSIADYNRHVSQNAARSKVSCDDLFFLNTLFEEVEEKVLGSLPSHFELLSPNNATFTESEVSLSWESSYSAAPPLDHYEVWLNCSLVATVPAGTTEYTTDSLSNGEYHWFVIAVCDNGDWRQSSGRFSFIVELPDIPANLSITDVIIANETTACFNALQSITISNFIVETGGSAVLIAGQNIHVMAGTEIESGANAHFYIDTTGNFCQQPETIVCVLNDNENALKQKPLKIIEDYNTFYKVFPNPTTGKLRLEFSQLFEDSSVSMEIYDIACNRILQTNLSGQLYYEFDLSGKPGGIYLIRVMTGNKTGVEKIIKQ